MYAWVELRLPDGSLHELGHGDVVGRLWSAALPIDDERISEAHALVSLRGGDLKLLALRGHLAVEGRPRPEVELTPGLRVSLADGFDVEVVSVELPDAVLAVEGDGLPRQVLGGVCSLLTRPRPRLAPGSVAGAAAVFWTNRDEWRLRLGDGDARPLRAGDAWAADGRSFRAVRVALSDAGAAHTIASGPPSPLRIVAAYDSVHLHREGWPVLSLGGLSARLLSELVALGGPASWEVVASELWRGESDRLVLRRRWDVGLTRLRRRLEAGRVRPDLVRADGSGQVELVVYPEDVVEDRT
jgi:hypothetical protein